MTKVWLSNFSLWRSLRETKSRWKHSEIVWQSFKRFYTRFRLSQTGFSSKMVSLEFWSCDRFKSSASSGTRQVTRRSTLPYHWQRPLQYWIHFQLKSVIQLYLQFRKFRETNLISQVILTRISKILNHIWRKNKF